jgi:hypothetical protein
MSQPLQQLRASIAARRCRPSMADPRGGTGDLQRAIRAECDRFFVGWGFVGSLPRWAIDFIVYLVASRCFVGTEWAIDFIVHLVGLVGSWWPIDFIVYLGRIVGRIAGRIVGSWWSNDFIVYLGRIVGSIVGSWWPIDFIVYLGGIVFSRWSIDFIVSLGGCIVCKWPIDFIVYLSASCPDCRQGAEQEALDRQSC